MLITSKNLKCKFHLSSCLLSLIILYLSSCQEKDYSTAYIDLNVSFDLPLIDIEKIVCLETNDEALIGDIHKIRYYKGNYYVMDLFVSKNLFLFDSLGGFITKLQRGRGPGEIQHFNEFFIDEENELIYVYDYPNKINVYDPNLIFLYTEIHEDLQIGCAEMLNSDTLLINWPRGDEDNLRLYSLYVLSEKRYLNDFLDINKNLTSLKTVFPISLHEGRILISRTLDNHLYTINIEDPVELLQPRKEYYFDFGHLAITEKDLLAGVNATFDRSHIGERIIAFYSLSETTSFISFSYTFLRAINFMLYSKESGKYYNSANLFEAGLLPICKLNSALSSNRFLAFANWEQIVEFDEKSRINQQLGQVSDMDNPCLIIFSLVEN